MAYHFPPQQERIIDRVRRQGHSHALRWLADLTDEQRAAFLAQLGALDFGRVRELGELIRAGAERPSFSDLGPAPVVRLAESEDGEAKDAVLDIGRKALADDRAAALTLAGGHGTRLGYDAPKGMYPIMPLTGKCLFQVFAEKILAARRRYGCRMPWLMMTAPTNDTETRAFFADRDFFGLGAGSVHFFTQQTNPILDAQGRLLLEDKGRLLAGPDGHGGVFEALSGSGLAARLAGSGHDLISCFQVDNPLVTVADGRFLGHHVRSGAEFSSKVVAKRDAGEGLGVAALRSGRPAIVEYIHLLAELAGELAPSGKLKYLYGSIAIHLINTDFAARVGSGEARLPWHVARKRYDAVDEEGNRAPPPGGCYKFERFVFDSMAYASACAFVEVDRESEFAPVKNAEGPDSPAAARAMMRSMWLGWLRRAGVDVSAFEDPAAELEIGPLFAVDSEELKQNLPPHWRPEPPVVLDR